jgi:mannose-1-phosphate guanylyltransferase
MSALINFSLRVDKLPKEKFIAGKDGAVYVNLTMSVNDETRYGNNTGIYVSQTQEEREAKKQKTYIGNGKVVWNNGTIVNAEKEVQEAVQEHPKEETADLPF